MRVIVEYQPMTLANRMAHKRMIRQMITYDRRSKTGVVPPDRTWEVVLLFAVCMTGLAVLSARWWLCL